MHLQEAVRKSVRDHEAKKCVGWSFPLSFRLSLGGPKELTPLVVLARRKRKRAAKQHVAIEDHGNDA